MSALDGDIDSPNLILVKLIKIERLKRFKVRNTRWDSIYPVAYISIITKGACQFKNMQKSLTIKCNHPLSRRRQIGYDLKPAK